MTYKLIHDGVVREVFINAPTAGENYIVCPYCAHLRKQNHQEEKKLSINMDKFPKPWRCKHCDARGHVMEKDYVDTMAVKPVTDRKEGLSISDGLTRWFWEERKISIATLRKFKVSMSLDGLFLQRTLKGEEALHLTWQTRKCINFPYLMGGMMINIKFRDEAKNFKMLKGADLIMYNIDSIADSDYAIITEGEFEPMSYLEAGIKPVISVPNGSAVSPSEIEEYVKTGNININTMIDMTYLDNVMDKFKNIKTFYLALDDDAAGYKLRELLARRLGKHRCKYIEFRSWVKPDGTPCKDPNDVLVHHGKEQLSYSINKAKPYPMKEVVTAKSFREKLIFGYDNETPAGLSTGYRSLDPHWRWMPGYFYALNGWPQSGKTTFMMNMAVITAALYGWRWGIYSPENYPIEQLIETAVEMYLGNTSRAVQSGDTFFALPSVSGRDLLPFVQEAFEKGAKTLVVDQGLFERAPKKTRSACQVVPDVQDAFNREAAKYFVPKSETLVAVTGTNGKTSVVSFVRQLWDLCDIKGASLGTMGVQGLGLSGFDNAGLTTADALTLHKTLQSLGQQGVKAVALEASSHGLHQKRLDGLAVAGAVFTNLSRDHLDYHQTEQDYFDAKTRLFLELLPSNAPAIICGDDVWGQKLVDLCDQKEIPTITYGFKERSDWRVEVQPIQDGQKVLIFGPGGPAGSFDIPFVGDFQALNVLAAFLVLTQVSNVPVPKVLEACQSLKTVKGRLERVGKTPAGAEIFVDYAHTPDALERALKALRPRTQGKLRVIFGCGGDRDVGKRPIMGQIAQEFADYIIVTDDNPRTEDPKRITDQILESGLQARVIHDRKAAIESGISELKEGDSLLVAGKGHETGQVVGVKVFPFDDSQVILENLRQ